MKKSFNKYKNKKVTVNGIKFDSKAEARRFAHLDMLERSGVISNLELQPAFEICPAVMFNGKKQRARKYVADFKYDVDGFTVVEDVKGFPTQEYKLKRNLFLNQYPQYKFIESK